MPATGGSGLLKGGGGRPSRRPRKPPPSFAPVTDVQSGGGYHTHRAQAERVRQIRQVVLRGAAPITRLNTPIRPGPRQATPRPPVRVTPVLRPRPKPQAGPRPLSMVDVRQGQRFRPLPVGQQVLANRVTREVRRLATPGRPLAAQQRSIGRLQTYGVLPDPKVAAAARRAATLKAQLQAALAGHASPQVVHDLVRRGLFKPAHTTGPKWLHFLPEDATATPKAQALLGVRPVQPFRGPIAGVGTSFLKTPQAVADVSHAIGGKGGVAGVIGNAGADLALGPTMAAGTLARGVLHPRKVAGETAAAIGQTFRHPVKSFEEHPVWTLQTFEGGRAALGRGAGALARGVTKGRVGDTARSPLSMVGDQGTRLVYQRRYSKDIMRQAVQRATDRRLKPVLDEHGNPMTVMQYGREVPVMRASTNRPVTRPSRLLKKRGDFEASRATARQQSAVAYEAHAAQQMLPTRPHRGVKVTVRGRTLDTAAIPRHFDRALRSQPANALQARLPSRLFRPEQDLVSMAVEKTLRSPETFRADLLKERARVQAEYPSLKSPKLRSANRFRLRTIDRALADPKAMGNASGIFDSARKFTQRINELQDQGVELHQLPEAAAARAKLFPYAMSHMGAVHGTDPTLDAYIRQSTADARALQARRNFHAKTDAERKAIDDRLAALRAERDHARSLNVEGLRGPDGRPLTNEDIHAHMRAGGVDPADVAYVPHRLDLKSATAYYQQALRKRPSASDARRTGAAYKAGATSPTIHTLAESMIRQAGAVTNIRAFDRFVHDAGIRHADGQLMTMPEAEHEIQRRSVDSHNRDVPGEPPLRAVRVFKAALSPEEQARVAEMQDPRAGAGVESVLEPWQKRYDPADRTSRNVVLMPDPLMARIDEHLQRSSPGAKAGQGVTNLFRQTVLPFSSKWLVGNVAEAVLRLGAVGATMLPGDRNMVAGRAVLTHLLGADLRGLEGEIGKQAARDVIDHLLGGQLYGNRSLWVRRSGQEIAGDVGAAVAQTPVIHELAAGYRGVTGGIFRLNKALEQRSQVAALGKFARRDIQQFTGSWVQSVRLQREAVAEAARGLVDTAKQHEAARFIDETLGQYSRFSPAMRHFIQNAAPFLPWYLNSVRFTFWTLPAHHPIKTALLVNAEKAFQQDWSDQHKDLPPGSLRTAIPRKGGWLDLARFTPFGGPGPVLAGDNAALVSPLYPQFQGAVNALEGKDPFGRTLQGPRTAANPTGKVGPGQQRVIAVNSFLEGIVPLLQLGRRGREGGKTAYPTSTILSPQTKPGTSHGVSAAGRIWNPFRPVYLRAQGSGQVVKPTTPVRPARKTQAQRDADLVRQAVHGPAAANGISSEDLDLIRRAQRP